MGKALGEKAPQRRDQCHSSSNKLLAVLAITLCLISVAPIFLHSHENTHPQKNVLKGSLDNFVENSKTRITKKDTSGRNVAAEQQQLVVADKAEEENENITKEKTIEKDIQNNVDAAAKTNSNSPSDGDEDENNSNNRIDATNENNKTTNRAGEPTNVCKHSNCTQADPHGSTVLGIHRGLALMLQRSIRQQTTNMQPYNLAYLFMPKAGSSTMRKILQNAGPTERVWLTPTTGTSTLDPLIFTMIRDPGERVVSAYSTIVARGGEFASNTELSLPETPKNTTDATAPEWKKHFQESIWQMMNSVKKNGWNNTNFHWNVHIVPQVEFMRGLNVSHVGCIGSINETLSRLHLLDAGKNVWEWKYERNRETMPSVKFGSYDMLSVETKTLIREVYEEDYALFGSLCTKNS